jgi:hypothetical protein
MLVTGQRAAGDQPDQPRVRPERAQPLGPDDLVGRQCSPAAALGGQAPPQAGRDPPDDHPGDSLPERQGRGRLADVVQEGGLDQQAVDVAPRDQEGRDPRGVPLVGQRLPEEELELRPLQPVGRSERGRA